MHQREEIPDNLNLILFESMKTLSSPPDFLLCDLNSGNEQRLNTGEKYLLPQKHSQQSSDFHDPSSAPFQSCRETAKTHIKAVLEVRAPENTKSEQNCCFT